MPAAAGLTLVEADEEPASNIWLWVGIGVGAFVVTVGVLLIIFQKQIFG